MCGIIGSINVNWKDNPLNTIKHRGPDYQSKFLLGNLYLGHTRLSIQDVSSNGNQPMITDDENFVIIFNGEIYNHQEIRSDLETNHGISFNSNSDTETLLYGWSVLGKDILSKLNGIFSFCIFDKNQNKIFLVRDPYGVKPLYIYHHKNNFAFSSELKSFNSIVDFKDDIDLKAISNYLTFLWSPGKKTMYKHVKKVLPNTLMEINLHDLNIKNEKFYHLDISKKLNDKTEKELIDLLDLNLKRAVKRQLLSDVPVGYFLSGGLDSSLIVAIAKKIQPNSELNCYTIKTNVVDGKEGFTDDLPYARKVAKFLDVNLIEVQPKINSVKNFDKMIYQLDEPQADLAPYNVKIICELASEKGIKVMIGGVGGDDLFSGYRRHQAIMIEPFLKFIPKPLLQIVRNIIYKMDSKKPLIRRLKKISKDWGNSKKNRLIGYFNWLPNQFFFKKLFSKKSVIKINDYNPYEYFYKIVSKSNKESYLCQMLKLEQKTFLVDHNLNYSDKMSMECGIELRVPFLDFDLVKFSHQLPDNFKIKNNQTKYLLKKVAERYLPKDVIYRSKTGFGSPVRNMINKDFKVMIDEYLNENFISSQGIFNSNEINKILESDKRGSEDFGYNILSLLSIQSWLKQFKNNKL